MKNSQLAVICLAFLAGLHPAWSQAAPEPDKESDAALFKMAGEKRAALLYLGLDFPDRKATVEAFGAFISPDGLALVGLAAVSYDQAPRITTADGKVIKTWKLLRLFPDVGLALMKLDHKPKLWLSLSDKEPEVGETVALIPVDGQAPGFGKIDPVVGSILVERSTIENTQKNPRFLRTLSLGARFDTEQLTHLVGGGIAINARGELAGSVDTINASSGQVLITISPAPDLGGKATGPAGSKESLPFPLPPGENPHDPALHDPDYPVFIRALQFRDPTEAQKLARRLLKRFPDSIQLRFAVASNLQEQSLAALLASEDKPRALGLEANPVPRDASPDKAVAVMLHTTRAKIRAAQRDSDGEIKEWEAAVRFAPKDLPDPRVNLASAYLSHRGNDRAAAQTKAEQLYRESRPYLSDTIRFFSNYERLLIRMKKLDEAQECTDRVFELSEIYRRKRGVDQ